MADLDESSWTRWDAPTCRVLAAAVVERVRKVLPSLPAAVLERQLPTLPAGKTIDDLQLERRTYNCVARSRLIGRPDEIGTHTIADIVILRNVGAKSLVDLLTSMEWLASDAPTLHKPGHPKAALERESNRALAREGARAGKSRWAKVIRRDDPRLGSQLAELPVYGHTLQEIAHRMKGRPMDPVSAQEATVQLRELRLRIRRLSELTLERELIDLASAVAGDRSARIAARRLGWDGKGRSTLAVAGRASGITRERVRQICRKVTTALAGKRPFAPALDTALDLIRQNLPGVADDVEQRLRQEGISATHFRLEGLENAIETLGRLPTFRVVGTGGKRLVLPPEAGNVANGIIRNARLALNRWGAATVLDISAQTSEQAGLLIEVEIAVRILLSQPDFSWLDEPGGWFWFRSAYGPRNRLLNQTRKILSVAEKIGASELRRGVSRHYRMKGFAPPRRVLLELCRQIPGYRVEGDTVIADPLLDWREVLAETERTFVNVLRQHGGVLQRERLEQECLAVGMKRSTFYVHLDYSPILARYARGVYGLRGVSIPPGIVESLLPKRRSGKVVLDYGWTSDGRVWLAYRLSEPMISSGVFTVPAGMKHIVSGKFVLRTEDGSQIGTLSVQDSGAWGLFSLFRRRGGEPGDVLILVVDLSDRTAFAQMGEIGLVDKLRLPSSLEASSDSLQAPAV